LVRVHDVPAAKLIEELATHLKRVPEIEPPTWASFVKTGSHADRPPQRQDWWYVRAASLMRKVYLQGPIGIEKLEIVYGGSKAVGYFPKHHRDSGSSAIRNILKGLEKAELVSKQGTSGRVLTSKGVALLDKISKDVFEGLVKQNPALERYS
jgi:small subunit ribosomal protein S19e